MISKALQKELRQLHLKKFRDAKGLFIAEGKTLVEDMLKSELSVKHLFYTSLPMPSSLEGGEEISEKEMGQITALTEPSSVLAVFEIPQHQELPTNIDSELVLALDSIRDPGNLGTIVRIADWFGIAHILCSDDTADCYNPKVVQASAGSLSRVKMYYGDLYKMIGSKAQVFGAMMEGKSVYDLKQVDKGVILIGNEANGISSELQTRITQKIAIPKVSRSDKKNYPESLNAAIAAGIICSVLRGHETI